MIRCHTQIRHNGVGEAVKAIDNKENDIGRVSAPWSRSRNVLPSASKSRSDRASPAPRWLANGPQKAKSRDSRKEKCCRPHTMENDPEVHVATRPAPAIFHGSSSLRRLLRRPTDACCSTPTSNVDRFDLRNHVRVRTRALSCVSNANGMPAIRLQQVGEQAKENVRDMRPHPLIETGMQGKKESFKGEFLRSQ
ncbi:hypothetical protein O1611_g916 [Lasiodiplodia mahajangana]|uniref:Uncharacterized protein n=1 Tax=Lasiodiplodia mahajangana TaxID=1108764 RepID=A0ACC2JZ65_9PEZI|nr:hypothetical protein O1611_g916 [Lasiodiplodia mahajangana]